MAAGARPNREPITTSAAEAELGSTSGWTALDGPDRLRKSLSFKTFRAAFEAASRIADLADAMDHHPDLTVSWGRLEIEVRTHDRDAITGFDIEFARRVDRELGL